VRHVGTASDRSATRKLHKQLHNHRTLDAAQVELNEKAQLSGAFAEPSDGLEPVTPSMPWRIRLATEVEQRLHVALVSLHPRRVLGASHPFLGGP
jgi:hypothetical protein